MANPLFTLGGNLFLNRPAANRTFAQFADQLDRGGQAITARFTTAGDHPFNRRLLNHIIGIERWGQHRLEVALGETLLLDEYNGYRPPRDTEWQPLLAEWRATRNTTLALIPHLEANADAQLRIPHNDFGPLTVGGWLHYLYLHAHFEARKTKQGAAK